MTEQAFTNRRFKEGDNKYRSLTDDIFTAHKSHKCPTYVHRTPPCQGSCPSGEDIRGWLQIVRGIEKPEGDTPWQEYAFRRSTTANPFPAIMGRVCPAPCQDGCNRNELEDFVGINSVEQFIGDYALENKLAFENTAESTGKKIAIIGGGIGGIACAYHLKLKGHDSTIFDEREHLGGMMRYGIPNYRTPRDVLDAEIQRIIDMGVEVRNNTRVGRDVSMEEIEKEFDAIVIAVGAQSGRNIGIPGSEAPNCLPGVAFLAAFNEGRLQHVGEKVVVIGGGDTAMDVVSVARRLGNVENMHENDRPENIILNQTAHDVATTARRQGANVMLVYRRPIEQMPAAQHEIEEAQEEGVTIRGSLVPKEVIKGEDGRATALRVAEVTWEGGNMTEIEGSEFDIECDLIVPAIGQGGDLSGLDDFDNGRGLVNADKFFQVDGKPGYFAIGDIIKPHLLTTAVGHASICAESIDHYLKEEDQSKRPKVDVHHFHLIDKLRATDLAPEDYNHQGEEDRGTFEADYAIHNYEDRATHEVIPHDELFLGHFEFTPRNIRQSLGVQGDDVIGHFEERMKGLDEEQAQAEAGRCMSCGMCFECDNCVIYCPEDAVHRTPKSQSTTGRYVYTDYSRCVGCHICSDVCPTGYIDMGLGE